MVIFNSFDRQLLGLFSKGVDVDTIKSLQPIISLNSSSLIATHIKNNQVFRSVDFFCVGYTVNTHKNSDISQSFFGPIFIYTKAAEPGI